ncbi:MAG: hypothetical protein V5783_10290 [Pontiella sp.]
MQPRHSSPPFKPIEDESIIHGLNELSRAINISSIYGQQHPAVEAASSTADIAFKALFTTRSKIIIGSFHMVMTIDEDAVTTRGTLLKSLERRLTHLHITSLMIENSITHDELLQLVKLLSCKDTDAFNSFLSKANLQHIPTTSAEDTAAPDGQPAATDQKSFDDLAKTGRAIRDDEHKAGADPGSSPIHTEQISAFLNGDTDRNNALREALTNLASDPERLCKIIIESASLPQAASDLSGESLGDLILSCLCRIFDGINKNPAFQTSAGKADLRKLLFMLKENLLDTLHDLATAPGLERQIVQAVREMDASLDFEQSALDYMECRKGIEQNKEKLQAFVQSHGVDRAEDLLNHTHFPTNEWKKIIIESHRNSSKIKKGLTSLTRVFERLENLIKPNHSDGETVKDLMGQANENLGHTTRSTTKKLASLSKQLTEHKGGTIGGHGRNMEQDDLLAALAEVAQELMQPLTAITASLEMMLKGFVGEITEDQRDLLNLSTKSGEHLKYLMKELIHLVGCPTNKGTDNRYHITSEQVTLMQEDHSLEVPPSVISNH